MTRREHRARARNRRLARLMREPRTAVIQPGGG